MSEPRQDEPLAIEGELVDSPDAPTPVVPEFDYTDDGVPNFDYVRNRIESRFATSSASTDLAGDAPEVTSADEQLAERERAGRDKLEEIRRSMRGE
jgi:phage shock protein A